MVIEILDLLSFAAATALMFIGLLALAAFGMAVLGHWR